ncbi:DUF2017 domain-containing protein [Streptomyces somaliensis DSM 40738]|uniref:DUF2017 domain-containing protein n=1 Tax=Streptomyces somaliensis (strain ATCC 33201 / DSM 40738 / JCM 12659 / KCTC 9044 / NCTC 11332 / NRRL B-12077 / IP 733) TaxID=1134445 RepID=A0AA44IEC5_STRE0|nr:DUF2017 domain-containing protein [Streptomyces somaliensis]MCQ0022895.1 DUF2017 domain-containing protein [Streptomyces somaliensis DSM 40738]NKY15625.1 DUF2017 domain-containing protein [Streptomyces somaliensis DSM 40738]
MSGHFEALPDGGAAVPLDEVEVSILRSLAVQMLELIGPGDEPARGGDPLAELFREGPSEKPSDPALARLFPDAYGDGDERLRAASAEFRRFTENDLRARKREDALAVVRGLDGMVPAGDGSGGGRLELSPEEGRHWLGALNDLRLTIGTRLEVTDEVENDDLYRLPDSDPRKPMVMAYLWLGALQETLVEALAP